MSDYAALIDLLKHPGLHSADKIATSLGISTDELSLQVKHLRQADIDIVEAIEGEYRLDPSITLLDKDKLRGNLTQSARRKINHIHVLQSVTSTNTFLLSKPMTDGKANVCLTEVQLAGRGRHGNSWHSASHRNLLFSISWEFSSWLETVTAVGLATALVIARRLNHNFDLGARIKWPNDILVVDGKLGGILIDAAGESGGACKVVIGVGLNIHQPQWPPDSKVDYHWQDMHSLGVAVDRNLLAAQLISDLVEMLESYESGGFAPMAAAWNDLHLYQGVRARVGDFKSADGGLVEGLIKGVDSDGALLVEDDLGKMHRFTDSNISVRSMT